MPSSPGPVGSTRMAFRMTIGPPRPLPGYPRHAGLVSAPCTSNPRFRHQLSSDPASRRAPLPRRMVPVITVHRGLTPLESDIILDTQGGLLAHRSQHPPYAGRGFAVLHIQCDVGWELAVMAVRAQVVWTRYFHTAHCGLERNSL